MLNLSKKDILSDALRSSVGVMLAAFHVCVIGALALLHFQDV